MSHARETTLTFFIMYLSPLMSEVCLLVYLFCVACVAWQTHRDHAVRWLRRAAMAVLSSHFSSPFNNF